jgi:hypothetical protein
MRITRIFVILSLMMYLCDIAIGGNPHALDAADGSPTDVVYVNEDGNVGIGVYNATSLLDVYGGAIRARRSGTQFIEIEDIGPSGGFITGYSREGNKKALHISSLYTGDGPAAGEARIQFRVGDDSSPTVVMTMLENGNVGIGTTFADAKLRVIGEQRESVHGHAATIIAENHSSGSALYALSWHGTGVYADTRSPNHYAGYFSGGVRARTWGPGHYAGDFVGDVSITGSLSKSAGSFKIDHPLDPENKYLQHSFVESPDMMNVYNGNVTLDENGQAVVELPAYFEALNGDFRYQLTPIGAPGPNLHIAEKIYDNRFKIAGGKSGMEVSWQVTGVRYDPYAVANPIQVEEDKPAEERGYYLHPDAYGLPEEKGIETVRNQWLSQTQ